MAIYPLADNIPEQIKSKTGKRLEDINIDNVLNGSVTSEDIKISKETLKIQGEIAEKSSRTQLKHNFNRAGELVDVDDTLILEIYNKLRPRRSTKAELLQYADKLENQYKAFECARLIREAAEVYERRAILKP